MVKLMYIIAPKAGMSPDEFQRYSYSLDTHAPIVKEIPHLERYVINIFRPRPDAPFHAIGGIAEQWFASAERMRAAFGTAAAERARADISNFAEVAQNVSGLVDEHIVV